MNEELGGGGVNERHNDGDDSVRAEEEWGRMNQTEDWS